MKIFRALKRSVRRLIVSVSDALEAVKSWLHGNVQRIVSQFLACLRRVWLECVSPVTRYIINTMKEHPWMTAICAFLLLCPGGTIIILGILGFTVYGPAIGSIAALIQSLIGNVASGSLFAFFQSAAMGGYGAAVLAKLSVIAAGTMAVAVGSFTHELLEGRRYCKASVRAI
ncbi:hypothetical protein ACMFMG_010037 [Clarireedia jacksonii]